MGDGRPEHGFTAVDEQADPSAWIEVLDTVRGEPAYQAYKARVGELLEPRPGQRLLEVGTGTGADALALADRFAVTVVGVDSSQTMVDEARRRGLLEAHVADAISLPFASATFDRCWADRTFQHLAEPQAVLAEMVRVTRASGRVLVVDPDYDTQVVDVADQELARRVLRFRADVALRNGTLAHRLGGLFFRAGLVDLHVEASTVVLRDPHALDNAMGLRSWAAAAHEQGFLQAEDVPRWEEQVDTAIAAGHFLYSFTLFLTVGTKPPAGA
jgi:SAM-dependent methyltransferase